MPCSRVRLPTRWGPPRTTRRSAARFSALGDAFDRVVPFCVETAPLLQPYQTASEPFGQASLPSPLKELLAAVVAHANNIR